MDTSSSDSTAVSPHEEVDKISRTAPSEEPRDSSPGRQGSWFRGVLEEVRILTTTRAGLIGDYDYVYLLTPDVYPFNLKYKGRVQPFFDIDERIPLLLTVLLGLQHALAMIGGLVTPPLLIAGTSGANLGQDDISYLISASLILSGVFSFFQIMRFRIFNTGLWIGTGMLSVVGEAFSIVPIAQGFFEIEYAAGRCLTDAEGVKQPCREAYGCLLGTVACVMLFQVALSLVKPRLLMKAFPKLVSGMVMVCIGASLMTSSMKSWAGGSGPCMARPEDGPFAACPTIYAPNPHPWGHPSFIGLGFSVYITILVVELYGSPLLRNGSIAVGLLVGAIISSQTNYIDTTPITTAPRGTFLWTRTFPLSISGTLVLPLLASCITTLISCLGDVVATAEVSGLDVSGLGVNDRVQGGLTGDALFSVLAPLATTTPTVCFAQNVGVISLTNCASRRAGYACCGVLVLAGVAGKFGAAIAALPASVVGGMTTFLFASIVTSGIRILAGVRWSRRSRFVATAALVFGISDLVVPNWALYLFPPGGEPRWQGLKDGVGLMVRTSYCVVALVGMLLNAVMAGEAEEEVSALPVVAEGKRRED